MTFTYENELPTKRVFIYLLTKQTISIMKSINSNEVFTCDSNS